MMDYSAASPPGTQTPVTGVPPRLGTPVPGTTGGLPAQQGLNVSANPMAQQLQSQGRGDDKMLVHMTPGEVGGLQQLAMAHGGSLTINPQTGLPEAGFLSKLLPTLIGFGLNFIPGVGPLLAAGITAAGATAVTGDLQKGLTAGLQAFGGAGLSGALAPGATASLAAKTAAPSVTAGGAGAVTPASTATMIPRSLSPAVTGVGGSALGPLAGGAINPALGTAAQQAATKAPGFLGRFAAETSLGQTGLLGKALPMVAGSSVLGAVSDATQPKLRKYNPDEEGKSTYAGPYVPGKRELQIQPYEEMMRTGGAERQMFTPSNPLPGFRPASSLDEEERAAYGFADGGLAELPASRDFQATMDYFNAQNPGAITASMYPVAAEMPTRETMYNFKPPVAGPATPTQPNIGGPGMGMIGMPDLSNIDLNNILAQIGYVPKDGSPATTPVPGRDIASAPTTDLYRGGIEIPAATSFNPSMPSVGGGTGGLETLTPSLNIQPPSQLYDIPAPQVMGIEEPSRFSPSAPQFDIAAPPAMGIEEPSRFSPMAPPIMGIEEPSRFSPSAPQMEIPSQLVSTSPEYDLRDLIAMSPAMPSESIYDMRYGRDMEMDEFARGGVVHMKPGSFVFSARETAEFAGGDTQSGQNELKKLGGIPIRGPGDGTSDSIKASIGGKQEARLANGEVLFPPKAVRRIGGGTDKKAEERGTKKLYALMRKAEQSRKNAPRGADGIKLRKGLA